MRIITNMQQENIFQQWDACCDDMSGRNMASLFSQV